MSLKLSKAELAALIEVSRGLTSTRLSHNVFKNVRALTGNKLAAYARKTGILEITPQGREYLFSHLCVETLRKLKADPTARAHGEALAFLLRKGHLEVRPDQVGHFLTTKGEESLQDIDAQG
ncbi:hypothetical protein [Chitinibacter sp. ZOR0017]|uniref:hypothetical protein n=1 Tax=Chitinibacter sp. ZOR0017 TaxID=1339254 RepID=UPI0006466C82|nr:hypothetical protein [Chitinibacter sp. ZOR0017]